MERPVASHALGRLPEALPRRVAGSLCGTGSLAALLAQFAELQPGRGSRLTKNGRCSLLASLACIKALQRISKTVSALHERIWFSVVPTARDRQHVHSA